MYQASVWLYGLYAELVEGLGAQAWCSVKEIFSIESYSGAVVLSTVLILV